MVLPIPSACTIEQMSKYELVIDLRVARKEGINVPQELLLRADERSEDRWRTIARSIPLRMDEAILCSEVY